MTVSHKLLDKPGNDTFRPAIQLRGYSLDKRRDLSYPHSTLFRNDLNLLQRTGYYVVRRSGPKCWS